MNFISKIYNWIFYRNESALDRNIRTTTDSFWRLDEQINDEYCSHYDCTRYSCKIWDKYERVTKWLCILLRKRGREEDIKFANYLDPK